MSARTCALQADDGVLQRPATQVLFGKQQAVDWRPKQVPNSEFKACMITDVASSVGVRIFGSHLSIQDFRKLSLFIKYLYGFMMP